MTVALAVTAAVDVPLRGGIGTHNDAPATVAELPATYHLGIGDENLDLHNLAIAGRTVHVVASVGIGHLYVVVPDVAVVVHARVGAGDIDVLGALTNGTHLDRTVLIPPSETPQRGQITLDLQVGAGQITVGQNPIPEAVR